MPESFADAVPKHGEPEAERYSRCACNCTFHKPRRHWQTAWHPWHVKGARLSGFDVHQCDRNDSQREASQGCGQPGHLKEFTFHFGVHGAPDFFGVSPAKGRRPLIRAAHRAPGTARGSPIRLQSHDASAPASRCGAHVLTDQRKHRRPRRRLSRSAASCCLIGQSTSRRCWPCSSSSLRRSTSERLRRYSLTNMTRSPLKNSVGLTQ